MAEKEVVIKVTAKTDEAQDSVQGLNKDLKNTGTAAKNAGDTAKKSTGLFKTLGNAVKALGIVTIIAEAFNFFREALNKNQRVADTLAAVFGTISSIISQFINIVIDVTSEVSKSTNGFDALGKVMSGILRLVINPFKLAFFNIKFAIEGLQLAWEKSILGSGDQTKIKELTKSLNETGATIKAIAVDQIQAAKQVVTNFVDAASSVSQVVAGTIEGAKKINVAATFEQQKSIVQLRNTAELSAAQLAGLVEQYDRLAEQQRQIRDDETKSIDERIAANEELGKILMKQRTAMLAQASKILEAAEANLAADKNNVQLKKAVIDATSNVAAVEAQITGFQSEQKVNAVALSKLKIDLSKQEVAAANLRFLNEQKAQAELIKDEQLRLIAKKQIFEQERQMELQRLLDIVNATNEGTEARVSAEIEYQNKKSELSIQGQQLEQQILETGINRQFEAINRQRSFYQNDFEMRRNLLEQEAILLQQQRDQNLITEQQYADARRNIVAQDMQIEMDKLNQQREIADQIIGLIGAETAAGRAALIVKQVLAAKELIMRIKNTISFAKISTAEASVALNTGAAQTAKIGFPQNIPMLIGYAVQAASIISAIRSAVKGVKEAQAGIPGAGGGIGSVQLSSPVQQQVAPQAQLQIQNQQAINNLGNQAVRAYVLNSDIRDNEQRNAYLQRNSRIG